MCYGAPLLLWCGSSSDGHVLRESVQLHAARLAVPII